jgi:peptidoglycan/xylan/chitin deacetylase (PgdA/CDA1 family)
VLDLEVFERHVKWLRQHLKPLTLAEAGDCATQGELPEDAVVITVDDGYSDCYEYIFPVLRKYSAPATFFVATGGVAAGQLWDERIAQAIVESPLSLEEVALFGGRFPLSTYGERLHCSQVLIEKLKYQPMHIRDGMIADIERAAGAPTASHHFLRAEQMREMSASGMELGAHTVNHPILAIEDDDTARLEIVGGKAELENMLQREVQSFAYPNGKFGKDFGPRHIDMVRTSGFNYAVSSDPPRAETFGDQPLCLGRRIAWAESQARFLVGIVGAVGQ